MRDTAPAVGTDCLAHTADLHSFHPQDMASLSPAWVWPVEVHRDNLAEASSGCELQKASCLGFSPGLYPLEARSYWGCSWRILCWMDSFPQGDLVGLADS